MFKIDMHVHTSEVSVCSNISAEEIVREYKAAGFGGVVITDHFDKRKFFDQYEGKSWEEKVDLFLEGYNKAKKLGDEQGLRVYLGMELRTPENDNEYLIYGFDRNFLLQNENLHLKNLSEVKKIVDKNNLVIIQAHPYRVMCKPVSAGMVHGIEVFNGHFCHYSHNDLAEKLYEQNGGIKTSGADAHDMCDIGNAGIIFEKEPANIADALRKEDYTLIKSAPQCAKIVFAKDDTRIKEMCAFKECDGAVICDGGFKFYGADGKVRQERDVFEINRCFVVNGVKNLKKVPYTEPCILLVEKICDEVKDIADSNYVVMVVGERSDDCAPYAENITTYMGYDMVESNMFSVQITGPDVWIEKINL